MKHIKKIITLLLLMGLFLPSTINANNYITIDKNSIMIPKGESKAVTISLNNAAGRLDINQDDSNIVRLDKEKVFLDQSSEEINIEALNLGSTTINISTTDVNTYDYQEINNLNYQVNVTVYMEGDINNNGKVNFEDIAILLRGYLGVEVMDETNKSIGDINKNGQIDLFDVIELLKIYLEIN